MYIYPEFKNPNLETYISDLKDLLQSVEDKVEKLLEIENKTYDNFLKPFWESYRELNLHSFYMGHINSVKNTDETQRIKTESLPIKSEWYTRMGQREDIYQALQEVYDTDLTAPQRRVIKESLLAKKLKGVGMDEESKKRIGEINTELSELSNQFSKNVLDATKEFTMEVTDFEDVKEFPKEELPRHKKEGTDHWEFTLQSPSISAYLKYGSNSDLRKQIQTAYVTRAPENEDLIEKMLTLKNEKANILGYKNHAEISLTTKMADSPEDVLEFLDRIKEKALPYKEKETQELLTFVKEEYGVEELNPWDKSYYINKYQEKYFDFKSEDLKPYFEQSKVLNGMFEFLGDKFGLGFVEVDTYVWDSKVKVYDVYRNGEAHSRVYFDLEARDDKRGGAWMNNSHTGYVMSNEEYIKHLENKIDNINSDKNVVIRSQQYEQAAYLRNAEKEFLSELEEVKESGKEFKVLPIAYVTCNFTPSTDDLPSLLGHGEVNTLFHEMGHVLQHICSEVEDRAYAGIGGIEWDAVEWSSQFLELFVFESDVLKQFGKHHETGETITDDLIEKINKLRTYRAGSGIIRQLEFGKFDMKIYTSDDTSKEYIQSTLDNIREELGSDVTPGDKFQCGFSHIFSGGYSAGYYSYKWAEVLSVDSFLRFREMNDSEDYYDKFLAKGSSLPSMDMFVDYMGRKPSEEEYVKYVIGE
ncbi:MAG: Oligopeptidase A [uncultured marine phage]|uniref:oligopeptidase A n=1 Tax=uncultured marine phage TaxID=707152 RepID=A0A8D9CG53_9VIRU|nr:MAG: Oligopeptidase A [uncultured marine phage]